MKPRTLTALALSILALPLAAGCVSQATAQNDNGHKWAKHTIKRLETDGLIINRGYENGIRLSREGASRWTDSLEPPGLQYILAWPAFLLYEAGASIFLEDREWPFKDRTFDNFIFTDRGSNMIRQDEKFEVHVSYLSMNNLTEGRLRDSLGGQGAHLSLQVSMRPLNKGGHILRDDKAFLIRESRKRRSELLEVLRIADKSSFSRLEKNLNELFGKDTSRGAVRKAFVNFSTSYNSANGDNSKVRAAYKTLQADLAGITTSNGDTAKAAEHIVGFAEEAIADSTASASGRISATSLFLRVERQIARAIGNLAHYVARFGYDEKGVYEEVNAIVGLSKAEFYWEESFSGVRPATLEFGRQLMKSPPTNAKQEPAMKTHAKRGRKGLVFSGTLADLDRPEASGGSTRGFSLSVLMLERDNDAVAVALRQFQELSNEADWKASVAGTEVPISAVSEIAATIAEDIAEDDVELKMFDLRFMTAESGKEASGQNETEMFILQPCRIVVARNLDDDNDYDAIAVIDIIKSNTKKADAAKADAAKTDAPKADAAKADAAKADAAKADAAKADAAKNDEAKADAAKADAAKTTPSELQPPKPSTKK